MPDWPSHSGKIKAMLGTLKVFVFAQLAVASPLTVLIDPGHGGRDRGTTRNEVHEADITLAISQHLNELLKRDKRFKSALTRSDDSTLSLFRRASLATSKSYDVLISIHVNSSPDPKAKGAEFYFQNQLPPDQESMYLAHRENHSDDDEKNPPLVYPVLKQSRYPNEVSSILSDLLDNHRVRSSSELSKALKLHWRGHRKSVATSIRQAPFFVLAEPRVPSALVEVGFLTNPDDYAQLVDPNAQRKMAADLHRGLVAYKESLDKRR